MLLTSATRESQTCRRTAPLLARPPAAPSGKASGELDAVADLVGHKHVPQHRLEHPSRSGAPRQRKPILGEQGAGENGELAQIGVKPSRDEGGPMEGIAQWFAPSLADCAPDLPAGLLGPSSEPCQRSGCFALDCPQFGHLDDQRKARLLADARNGCEDCEASRQGRVVRDPSMQRCVDGIDVTFIPADPGRSLASEWGVRGGFFRVRQAILSPTSARCAPDSSRRHAICSRAWTGREIERLSHARQNLRVDSVLAEDEPSMTMPGRPVGRERFGVFDHVRRLHG